MFIPGGSAIETGGYNINNSVRLRQSASAYLSRSFSASSTDRKKGTLSFWIKRGVLSTQQCLIDSYDGSSTGSFNVYYLSGDTIVWRFGGGALYANTTSAVYRDPSAWYNVVLVWDTTQATDSNRMKLYINGTQQTFGTTSYPALNATAQFPQNGNTKLCCNYNASGEFSDVYLAEYYFIDGQALTPSSFGATDAITGVWAPAAYTGSYGTNGFYLKFSDIATTSGSNAGLGKDFSGNGNYWTTNNISVTAGTTYDAMTDSPTLTSATVANYAVLNPLGGQGGTWSNGNLKYIGNTNWRTTLSTIEVPTTGKWYAEATLTGNPANNTQAGNYAGFGITPTSRNLSLNMFDGNALAVSDTGFIYNFVAYPSGTNLGSAFASGDVIGLAVDTGANTYTFYKNNVSVASGTIGITAGTQLSFGYSSYDGNYGQMSVNFGQQGFKYTPPTGYVALNAYNLPDSTIKKGNSYMDATLYAGNGSSQSITNTAGFKPDLVWIKDRTTAQDNNLFDSIRGTGLDLFSNKTDTETNLGTLTAFNSNGFTVLKNGVYAGTNASGSNFVGWQWQAGQGSTSSNTSGSITSTISVNTTAGFSIVTWSGNSTSGATIGHGLGVAPKMIIVKNRTNAEGWVLGHTSIGWSNFLQINNTNASASSAYPWNNTAPSSTLITLGSGTGTNGSGYTYVGYAWAEIAGFSKFGSYTGNGSADGPFVFLGFKPRYLLVRRSDAIENWIIYDTSRSPYNLSKATLQTNSSSAENASDPTTFDILSNGFKARNANMGNNTSGGTYIYAAFAENPFKNALAR